MRKFVIAVVLIVASGCSSGTSPAPTFPTPVTWQIQAGTSSDAEALQGLAFYPGKVTIDAGDTIRWNFPANEPHTVALLGAGQTKPPSALDPNNSKPTGGAIYDGSTFTNSGYLFGNKSYALTFTKPGTYTVYCLIHLPEMVETVVVQPAASPYPQTQASYSQAAVSASAGDLSAALASISTFPYTVGSEHLAAGISPGGVTGNPNTATVMRFLSTSNMNAMSTTVSVGTTVTWTNLSNNEPHTVTFAPFGQTFPTLNPFSPPSGGNVYDGSRLVNSGPLFAGQSFSITFTRAGNYSYHCIFHDDTEGMIANLVVQ